MFWFDKIHIQTSVTYGILVYLVPSRAVLEEYTVVECIFSFIPMFVKDHIIDPVLPGFEFIEFFHKR